MFEEALAQAAYFLEPGSPIARTVRNAEIIDNVWESGSLSPQVRPCKMLLWVFLPFACPDISQSLQMLLQHMRAATQPLGSMG